MKAPRILVYGDRQSKASAAPIPQEISALYNGAISPRLINKDQITPCLFSKDYADLFILPGIDGEVSLYPDHIGERGNDVIRNFVSSGGGFIGLCAGGFYGANMVRYTPPWGAPRGRNSGLLSLFNGKAYGPVPDIAANPNAEDSYKGLTTTPIRTYNGAQSETLQICYSSGPTFEIPPEQKGIKVIAEYEGTSKKLPAAINFNYGNGAVVLSGVLPQYGFIDCDKEWRSAPSSLKEVMRKLEPYEDARKSFLLQIINLSLRL